MKAPNKTKLITVQDIDGNYMTFSAGEVIDSDVIETPFVEELKITLNTLFVASTNLKTIKQNETV
jgi:hypothetical protein